MHGDAWFGALLWVGLIYYWFFHENSSKVSIGKLIRLRFRSVLTGVASVVALLFILSPFDLPFAGPMWRALVYAVRLLLGSF